MVLVGFNYVFTKKKKKKNTNKLIGLSFEYSYGGVE